jgi:hypothetical protein
MKLAFGWHNWIIYIQMRLGTKDPAEFCVSARRLGIDNEISIIVNMILPSVTPGPTAGLSDSITSCQTKMET